VSQLTHKHPTLGVIYALLAAVLFGINASTTKTIMESGISAESVVFIRAASTGLLALGWALVTNPRALRVPAQMIPALLLLGVVGVGMLQWTYSIAVSILPIGIALLFEYTAVLLTPLAAIVLFRERVKPQIWFGAALVLGGLAVVAQIWQSELNLVGVGFALAAAVSLTTFFLSGERIQRQLPTNVTMFYGMLIAAVLFAPFANLRELSGSILSQEVSLLGNLSEIQLPLWTLLLWLGLLGAFIPMAASYLALRHLSATAVGVIATSEIVFAFVVAYLWLQETITLTQTLGGIIVIVGILIAQTSRRQAKIGN
jgi:drug/metabolite transporter (DMT)-like permease